jgi:signal transduction histidine kinase
VTHDRVAALFGPVDEKLAEFVATLAGAALENADNFSQVEALSGERERLYKEAQQAIVLRDDFLSVASHELKTPVTSLWLNAQLLERAAYEGALMSAKDVLRIAAVEKQSRRLGDLMDELLDLSRLAHGGLPLAPERVDLRGLADTVVARLAPDAAAAGCVVMVEGPSGIVGQWDRSRLEQVATNLLANAVKFGAGRPIVVTVSAGCGKACLSVRDQGEGIAPEDQDRIFERFERAVPVRHFGGFGLGLWIARRIVEAMGGKIRVESRLGEGACFVVELGESVHVSRST